jgi:hypothetical protein
MEKRHAATAMGSPRDSAMMSLAPRRKKKLLILEVKCIYFLIGVF